jgi:hypothetical protein
MRQYILWEQAEDGYLRDHVATTFHAANYFRLIGEPTPKADAMIDRVLKDQKEDGSCHLRERTQSRKFFKWFTTASPVAGSSLAKAGSAASS